MRKKDVIAVLCSDIHLSHKPPVARATEPDWYEAMARPLRELRNVALSYNVPIVCAGDIFDRWNSPPELVNFAIKEVPHMFAVPGQHDLPNHSYKQLHRSAYWTLMQAGIVTTIPHAIPYMGDDLIMYGFPWGHGVDVREDKGAGRFTLAVVHEYCWAGKYCYPGAPEEQNIVCHRKNLDGYDAAVFGDNHKGFVNGNICNCGSFMKRNIDQFRYKPFIGLLYSDGNIKKHFLDTSDDMFIEVDSIQDLESTDFTHFVEELKGLGPDSLDFRTAIEQYLNNERMDGLVKELVTRVLEEEQV